MFYQATWALASLRDPLNVRNQSERSFSLATFTPGNRGLSRRIFNALHQLFCWHSLWRKVCRPTPRRFLSQGPGNGRWIVSNGNVGTTERKNPGTCELLEIVGSNQAASCRFPVRVIHTLSSETSVCRDWFARRCFRRFVQKETV